METHVLRDTTDARRFLAQGLWWQRVLPPTAATVRAALSWAKELASGGAALPPVGFVADLGHVAFGEDWERRDGRDQVVPPSLPVPLLRTYEDYVLGKVYADHSFSRASDALHKYAKEGRERPRGLAYLLGQLRARARFDAVELPVGVLNAMLDTPPEEILAEGYDSMRLDGPHPLLPALYESLILAARRVDSVLGPKDLFNLESKAALDDLGERLAHEQILDSAERLDAALPKHKVRPLAGRQEVPTRILDEDTYPVGGFTSISNRGSVESLLHSQLAYMETDKEQHPDLFDTMYLMDELLYYSRDENQFLRRRRTFVIALAADLVETRFKDAELPYQRGVMLLGLVHVLVKRLAGWLSTDALTFQILFLGNDDSGPLARERALLQKLFHEEIALGVVRIGTTQADRLAARCADWARKQMVHCLAVGVRPPAVQARDVVVARLAVSGPRPMLGDAAAAPAPVEGDDAADVWANALRQILMRWV